MMLVTEGYIIKYNSKVVHRNRGVTSLQFRRLSLN